jgi:hypothetical protein
VFCPTPPSESTVESEGCAQGEPLGNRGDLALAPQDKDNTRARMHARDKVGGPAHVCVGAAVEPDPGMRALHTAPGRRGILEEGLRGGGPG